MTKTLKQLAGRDLTLDEAVMKHGLNVVCQFVPFSESRNAKPNPKTSDLSLNWKVTLCKGERPIVGPIDYMEGVGHSPAHKRAMKSKHWDRGLTINEFEAVRAECETGRLQRAIAGGFMSGKELPNPSESDVVYSLLTDADALNYSEFDEWAGIFGYDGDSRTAESLYRTCLNTGLKLRNGLGEKALAELQEAAQEY